MRFSLFLALRYLKPKRTFISIITVISIVGVALGVGVLMVVIAVMSGFEKRIKEEWLRVEPPIHLIDDSRGFFASTEMDDGNTEPAWRGLLRKIKAHSGVQSASAFINVVALAQTAAPKSFDDIRVDVGNLPPPEPPPPPEGTPPPPPEGTPAPEPAPSVPAPAPAPTPPVKGPQGDPATPGKPAEKPAPTPPADATQSPPADPAPPAPADPDPANPPTPDSPDDQPPRPNGEEEPVTGLDRTRPLAPVMIIGVDTDDPAQMDKREQRFRELLKRKRMLQNGMEEFSAVGEFDISGDTVVLSHEVTRRLARGAESGPVWPGKTRISLFGPSYINEGIDIIESQRQARGDEEKQAQIDKKDRDYPLPMDLGLTGIFDDDKQTGGPEGGIGYVRLETAQKLAGAGKAVDGIYVDIDDPYDAPAMAKELEAAGLVPPGWRVQTWIERHRQQFEAVANERSMMYVVLAFITLVAAFCIGNTMITFAVQKRREIGMMRALGAKTSHIVSLFMTKGLIVGVLGTGLGYTLGRLVLYFRNDLRDWINTTFGHQIFDASIYGLTEIPAELRGLDQIYICSWAVGLCILAAMFPAMLVGYMEPAKALRNDR